MFNGSGSSFQEEEKSHASPCGLEVNKCSLPTTSLGVGGSVDQDRLNRVPSRHDFFIAHICILVIAPIQL